MTRAAAEIGARPVPNWRVRRILVTVESIVGIGALYGGYGLLHDAEGFGARQAWLEGSVFPDYTVPGVVLAVAIGGGMLAAAAITAFAGHYASVAALVMGVVILGWGVVETLTLGLVGGAQIALLWAFVVAPGVALTLIGVRGLRAPEPRCAENPHTRAALAPMRGHRRERTLTAEGDERMTLTRRDAIATVFTGLAALALLIALAGWNVPLIGDSYRWAAVLAFLFGACAGLSGRPLEGHREPMLGALGIVALALAILAIATGSAAFLILLVADTIVLWAATTMRHARVRRGSSLPSQV